jgi:hypothetical protein
MRVWPPTRITSSISAGLRLASFSGVLDRALGLADQVCDQVLELGARERHHEVLGLALGIGRDSRAG